MDDVIVGSRSKGISYSLDFHTHDYNELILLHGGNCRFLVGNQFYYLQPGNLLMFNGNTTHKAYVSGETDTYERSVLHFKTNWIKPLLKKLEVEYLLDLFTEKKNTVIHHFPRKEEEMVEKKIRKIEFIWRHNNLENQSLSDVQLKLLVIDLLIYIYQSNDYVVQKEEMIRDEKTKSVERISNFLFLNYQQTVTIDDVSSEVGLTKSYMSHLFKEVTGSTIMNYLMAYRLSQARNLLLAEPHISIKQVALKCGFKSIAHFCRYFKSNIGVTPREYRNNQLSAIGENQPSVEEYEEMYASFFKEIKDREERD